VNVLPSSRAASSAAIVWLLLVCVGSGEAQSGTGLPATSSDPGVLARARQSLAAGKFEAAIADADTLLARDPRDEAAAAVKVTAYANARDLGRALDAYQSWQAASKTHSRDLLAVLGTAHLRTLAASAVPDIRITALRHLAGGGDDNARSLLVKLARTSGELRMETLFAREAMAAAGDALALKELHALARQGSSSQRTFALRMLGRVDGANVGAPVAAALQDRDPFLRAAALEVAAQAGTKALVPAIKPLLNEPGPLVGLHAAAALHRLGDAFGDRVLEEALGSPVPDIRLIAAGAYRNDASGDWKAAITPLLEDRDGVNRIRAAELLLGRHPRAKDVLETALQDANPAVREEAVKVLSAWDGGQVATFVPLLRDSSESVRLHTAARLAPSARPASAR
jgi:HEAT repeat protein